MVLVVDLEGVG
jgi:hydrocephalus-inducing protein